MTAKIYYDDTCALCNRGAKKLRDESDIETVGASSMQIPSTIDPKRLMYEIHAVDEAGTVYGGVDALIKILEWHPRFKKLAPIVRLPGIKQFVAVGYWIVARLRHLL